MDSVFKFTAFQVRAGPLLAHPVALKKLKMEKDSPSSWLEVMFHQCPFSFLCEWCLRCGTLVLHNHTGQY